MAKTIRGRSFEDEWIEVRDGDRYFDCTFVDCVVDFRHGRMKNATFDHCTLVGFWPGSLDSYRGGEYAVRADEPEVTEARVGKSIRPAPRPRRSIFNLWRKRN